MKRVKVLVAVAILLACWTPVLAQSKFARLDSLFESRFKEGIFNGNALVAQDGKIVYQHAFGFADLRQMIPNQEATRQHLGSTSKLYTAVAILQLKEKELINLQDPVVKYFPDFPYANITIWHLLTHTSGLPDFQIFDAYYAAAPHQVLTNKDLIPAIKNYGKLLFEPGEKWSYSSPGYGLLASIVEKVSRISFEQYLKKNIWGPAGMKHSYINSLAAPVADTNRAKNYATTHYYSTDLQLADTMKTKLQFAQVSGAVVGPGLVVSDTKDLLLFDQALYRGKLLKPATMAEAFTAIKLSGGEYARPDGWLGDTFFGLGWFIVQGNASGKMVLHTGKTAGLVTVFIRNLTKKQTVIIFDNTESFGLNNLALNAFNILNDNPISPLKKSLAKLYANELVRYGPDFALSHFNQLKSDTVNYYLNVQEMDYAGHQLIDDGYTNLGLETLKLLTLIDPGNSFPFYSYGIALRQAGKKPEAIMNLKRALGINKHNKEAASALEQILK